MFLVTIGRWSVSVPKQTLGHDSSHSDWPDLQFGVEDIKTLLSRTTNGLFMQCTHALNYHRTSCGGHIELPWKCSLRLMHSTMTGEAGLEHGTLLTGRCLVSDATTPQCQAEHALMIRSGRTISPQCQAEDVSP